MNKEFKADQNLTLRATITIGCALLLTVCGAGVARAQDSTNLPAYESFPTTYTEGEALGGTTSAPFWSTGNSASGSSAVIRAAAAMGYPSLTTEAVVSSRGIRGGSGTGKNRGFFFSPTVNNNTVYASFLFTITNYPSSPRLFTCLSSGSGTGPSIDAGIYIDTAGHLLAGKNAALAATSLPNSTTTYSLSLSNTYLVVLRYKFNSGNSTNDEVALWIDPPSLGASTAPAPSITVTNGNDTAGSLQTFYYVSASSGLNTPLPFLMDEIRVGTNWAQVTPTNSIAGNIYNVTGGGNGCPGNTYPIGLNGSDTGVTYLLYTNGVPAGQSVDGTGSALSFGTQSTTATYSVLATNNTTGGVSWMGSNAVISVLASPNIVTQPTSIVAALNSTILYSVLATGDGLAYQWYRNNGTALTDSGRIIGSTTPTLTIASVQSGDAATSTTGYYCIITNSCGYMVISTTNALTIQTANNLVWQGTPTNTWDIATTANWTNSSGIVTVFNTGDNVTFDSSAQNSVVILSSPYLSPGTIIYNSSSALAITGTGNIFGSNSVLNAIGTGTLTISNANTFGGGTTISNATVAVRNYGALGSGAVNLAGGSLGTAALDIPIAGSASAGLYNNLNVNANSILQFDGTGTYGCVVFGALSGNNGTTLTVNHTGAGPDRLRLYNTNFTLNANLILNGAGIQLAPYHGNGTQTYNGVISGSGGIITRNSGADIILNNANTYSGGTTLSLGSVGIGNDSAFGTGAITNDQTSGASTLYASGGAHTVANTIYYSTTTNIETLIINGANQLTLSGAIDISTIGTDTTPTNRTIQVDNTAPTIFSGVISDKSLGCGINKTGNGALYLNGANTYTGTTTVSSGRLSGTGSIAGPVVVQTNGVIGGGSAATIGTLTINGSLTLTGGGYFRLSKGSTPSNDVVAVTGTLTNTSTGTITVTNLGATLSAGDKFQLFSRAVSNGVTLTISGGNSTWTNLLDVDGSIQVLSSGSTASYPTNITFSVSGSSLNISWPSTHLGWILQCQTNNLNTGLLTASNAWFDVPNSGSTTQQNITVNPSNPTVFYRLRHP